MEVDLETSPRARLTYERDGLGTPMSAADLRFTHLQGQYLAFIRAYSTINRHAPSEADMQRFFSVTAPSIHQMVPTDRLPQLQER